MKVHVMLAIYPDKVKTGLYKSEEKAINATQKERCNGAISVVVFKEKVR